MLEKNDVAHQQHYEDQKIQPIEYMQEMLPPDQFKGYLIGNIIKYVSRHQRKNGLEDLKKAQVYLGWLIQFEEAGKITVREERQ